LVVSVAAPAHAQFKFQPQVNPGVPKLLPGMPLRPSLPATPPGGRPVTTPPGGRPVTTPPGVPGFSETPGRPVVRGAARPADVAIINNTSGTIEVQVDYSQPTQIKSSERVVFDNNNALVKVTVYSGGSKKASATVKGNGNLVIESRNGAWIVKAE